MSCLKPSPQGLGKSFTSCCVQQTPCPEPPPSRTWNHKLSLFLPPFGCWVGCHIAHHPEEDTSEGPITNYSGTTGLKSGCVATLSRTVSIIPPSPTRSLPRQSPAPWIHSLSFTTWLRSGLLTTSQTRCMQNPKEEVHKTPLDARFLVGP